MAWCCNLGPHITSDNIPPDLRSRFAVDVREHRIGQHLFRLLAVRNPDILLDAMTPAEFSVDERLPYWAELWTSSLALAEYCLGQPALHGKTVLDLGCGLGLSGIAAARCGASVVFADYEQDAVWFAEWNARANLDGASFANAAFRIADWRSPDTLGQFDLVLGADIVYERRNFLPLLHCLTAVIGPGGEAWLAEPDRALGSDFFSLAREHGWTVNIMEKDLERRGRTSRVRIGVIHPGARS
jgi:predicted nicotinamide N-methyase